MNRYHVVYPAIVPLAYLVGALVIYSIRVAIGRPPSAKSEKHTVVFSPFWANYAAWIMRPLEKMLSAWRLTPNKVTALSLVLSIAAGVCVATFHFAMATWLYVLAGILDSIDGRLARRTGLSSESGAFLDSVLDRWGELVMGIGFAWAVRDSWALLAVLVAIAGSLMVSYTRARGEGLGIVLSGGRMQRPERIVFTAVCCFVTAWVHAGADTAHLVPHVLGGFMAVIGVATVATATRRLYNGFRQLPGPNPASRPVAPAVAPVVGASAGPVAVSRPGVAAGAGAPGSAAAASAPAPAQSHS